MIIQYSYSTLDLHSTSWMHQHVLDVRSMLLQLQFSPYALFPKLDPFFQLRIPSIAPNDASVRALNRLTDMKHLKAAFFHTGPYLQSYCVANSSDGATKWLYPSPFSQLFPPYPCTQCQFTFPDPGKGLASVAKRPLTSLA